MTWWVFGNWKMHGSEAALKDFVAQVPAYLPALPAPVRMGVAPPILYGPQMVEALRATSILVGAQNASHQGEEGALTGQVSPLMLRDVGLDFVILGHSECRAAGETDALIFQKVQAAWDSGLSVILCVGESGQERESGHTHRVLEGQIGACLPVGLKSEQGNALFLAYEPLWAIGTGVIPETAELRQALAVCRAKLESQGYGLVPVLYGGSVNPGNIGMIISNAGVEGVLVGKASLKAKDFFDLGLNCP